jgi:hypothetical protein
VVERRDRPSAPRRGHARVAAAVGSGTSCTSAPRDRTASILTWAETSGMTTTHGMSSRRPRRRALAVVAGRMREHALRLRLVPAGRPGRAPPRVA